MSYMIRTGQNLRTHSHLIDDEMDTNYCIAFFQAEDVGSSAKVPALISSISCSCPITMPGQLSYYSSLFIVYKLEFHRTPVELPVSITCLCRGVEGRRTRRIACCFE